MRKSSGIPSSLVIDSNLAVWTVLPVMALMPPLEPMALYWSSKPSCEPTAGIQVVTSGETKVLPAPLNVVPDCLEGDAPAVPAATIASRPASFTPRSEFPSSRCSSTRPARCVAHVTPRGSTRALTAGTSGGSPEWTTLTSRRGIRSFA